MNIICFSMNRFARTLAIGAFALAWGASGSLASNSQPGPPDDQHQPKMHPDRASTPKPSAEDDQRPGRGFRGQGHAPSPLWNRLSQEERQHIEGFIEEHFPMMYEELRKIKIKHPERFERRLRKMAPEIRHLMELIEVDPQRARLVLQERRLDMRIRLAAHRYHTAGNEEERRELREYIHGLVQEAFNCRMERRELEIRDLEARLAELRDRLGMMEEMREARVEREMSELLEAKPTGDRPRRGEKGRRDGAHRGQRKFRGDTEDRPAHKKRAEHEAAPRAEREDAP